MLWASCLERILFSSGCPLSLPQLLHIIQAKMFSIKKRTKSPEPSG